MALTILQFGSRKVVGTSGPVEKYIEKSDMPALLAFRAYKDGQSASPYDTAAKAALDLFVGPAMARLVVSAMTPETRDQIPMVRVALKDGEVCLPPRDSWLVKFALSRMDAVDRITAIREVVRSYRKSFPSFDAVRILAEIGLGDVETHGVSAIWARSPHFKPLQGTAYLLRISDVPYARVYQGTNFVDVETAKGQHDPALVSYEDVFNQIALQQRDPSMLVALTFGLVDVSYLGLERSQALLSRIKRCGETYVIDPDARYSGHQELRIPLGTSVSGELTEY